MLGERKRGLDGNSVKRASIGEADGSSLNSCSIIFSRVSMSESRPFPKKWQPGPHFSSILSVSVYGNLRSDQSKNSMLR